jgi:hypothetical protein
MLQDVDAVVVGMQCFDMLQQSGLHILESLYPSETTRNHFSDVREGILHVLRRKAFNSSDVILKFFLEFGNANPKGAERRVVQIGRSKLNHAFQLFAQRLVGLFELFDLVRVGRGVVLVFGFMTLVFIWNMLVFSAPQVLLRTLQLTAFL